MNRDTSAGGPRRVIVVDDSEIVLERLREMLTAAPGVTVVGHADDPGSALSLIELVRPDAVILDIKLRTGSGITILERLRELKMAPQVIVLTNYPHVEYRSRCLALGARAVLDKSSEFDRVVPLLHELLPDAAPPAPA